MNDQAPLNTQELAEIAQARAAFLSFLSLHFNTLPDTAFVAHLRDGELSAVLDALMNDPSIPAEIAAGARLMVDYLEQTRAEDPSKLSETLGVDRTRLYRGVAQGFGPPPPYEMVWSKTGEGFGVLQKVAGVYREAGLETSPDAQERLDYIGIELDFVRELALREADAWQAGSVEVARELLKAQQTFIDEHLGQWVPPFIQKAQEYVETDFYRGHMAMLQGYLAEEAQALRQLVEETGG